MKIIFQEAFVKAFFVLKESVLAFIPFGVGFKEYLAAYPFIHILEHLTCLASRM